MARTAANKKIKVTPEETPKKSTNFFDYLRFGESYTSLILGIIVVIIATALLLSFVHNKNVGNRNTPIDEQTQNTAEVSQRVNELSNQAPSGIVDNVATIVPTDTIAPTALPTSTPVPTAKPKPTAKPMLTVKPKPTIKSQPTIKPKVVAKSLPKHTSQRVMKKIAVAHQKKVVISQVKNNKNNNVWVVQKGDSLWSIAEKKYTSGYNWTDIARVNNLSNPSDIHLGDKLILPNVPSKTPTNLITSHVSNNPLSTMTAITGNSYTVIKGDNLWNIAVRAYGDGFRYEDIARANNLANPRMIFSGNVLQIPR